MINQNEEASGKGNALPSPKRQMGVYTWKGIGIGNQLRGKLEEMETDHGTGIAPEMETNHVLIPKEMLVLVLRGAFTRGSMFLSNSQDMRK